MSYNHRVYTVYCKIIYDKEATNELEGKDKKKELGSKMKTEIAPTFFKNMITILTKNGGQYMVGKGVSLVFTRGNYQLYKKYITEDFLY